MPSPNKAKSYLTGSTGSIFRKLSSSANTLIMQEFLIEWYCSILNKVDTTHFKSLQSTLFLLIRKLLRDCKEHLVAAKQWYLLKIRCHANNLSSH